MLKNIGLTQLQKKASSTDVVWQNYHEALQVQGVYMISIFKEDELTAFY